MPPSLVLIAAWCWLLIYAYPGLLTQDSYDHLTEAKTGLYTDAHPPFLNTICKYTGYVIAGQFGVLVIQATLLIAGLYGVLRHALSPRGAAWAAAGVFLFPPIMFPMAVIWKDCLMAGALMLGVAWLLSPTRWVRVAGLAGMFLATAVRYNALAATLPLVVLLFEWAPGLRWWKRYGIAIAAWLAITLAAFGLNAALTDRHMYYWHSSIAVHDITGTLIEVDPPLSDAKLEALLAGTDIQVHQNILQALRDAYAPTNFSPLISGPHHIWNLPTGGTEPPPRAQRDAIAAAWLHIVTSYPGAYLKHRSIVMLRVLAVDSERAAGLVSTREVRWKQFAQDTLGLETGSSALQYALMDAASWTQRHIPLFTPWMYVVLALVLLWPARRQRDVLALLLSGLALEGSLLFLAPSRDFRYSHWLVITVVVSAVMLAWRRRAPATET